MQLTSGGVLVAEHDPVGDGEAFAGDSFDDVLAVAIEAGLHLLVDFKSTGDPHAEAAALAGALVGEQYRRQVIVSSFDLPFLEAFAEREPTIEAMPIISMRQNFPVLPDLDRWAGASVLAAAVITHPILAWRMRRAGKFFVWFGAAEWSVIKNAMTRLGADALILKHPRR